MDLISRLPNPLNNVDTIWVIVEGLTNSAHFIKIRKSSSLESLTKIYVKGVIASYGVLGSKISNRDVRFTSRI